MSFYAGRYGTKVQCHLTNEAEDITTMRSTPGDSTVFHTDINYLDFKFFDLADIGRTQQTMNGYWNSDYGVILGGVDVGLYDISKNSELYDLIFVKKNAWFIYDPLTGTPYNDISFYLLVKESLIVTFSLSEDPCLWAQVNEHVFTTFEQYTLNIPAATPSSPYKYLILDWARSNLQICVLGMSQTGGIVPLTPGKDGTEIKMTKDQFTVGNRDILTMKYLSPNIINSTDVKMNSDGHNFQFINSVTKGSGLNIITNSTETTVSKGGVTVLTTKVGSAMLDIRSVASSSTVTGTHYNNVRFPSTVYNTVPLFNGRTFKEGEVLVFTYDLNFPALNLYSGARSSSRVYKYENDSIGIIYPMLIQNRAGTSAWAKVYYRLIKGSNGTISMRSELTTGNDLGSSWDLYSFGGTITVRTLS